jgi:hypothetical protein
MEENKKRTAAVIPYDRKVLIMSLHQAGRSYKEIMEMIPGVSKGSISNICNSGIQADTELVESYRKNRADIFASKQRLILDKLDEDAAAKMMDKQPSAAALWFNSLFNNERLERGQSTENVSVLVNAIQDLQKRRREKQEPQVITQDS